jgi:hypothetical protein
VSDTELRPKQEMKITMKTDVNSYIGLACADQNLLLMKKGE